MPDDDSQSDPELALAGTDGIQALLDEFKGISGNLSDAELVRLALVPERVGSVDDYGDALWERLALVELHCRLNARGRRTFPPNAA